MKGKLPLKLGNELWFSFSMVPFALFFAYLAVLQESGRNLVGSLLVAAIFMGRAYDRMRKVRLARFMGEHPEWQRIYDSWNGDS